jgi:hypothetical protein
MNCKAGDIAIISGDFRGCERNLGKLVRVHSSGKWLEIYGCSWVIEPLDDELFAIKLASSGRVILEQGISAASEIIHPDIWLIPIRSQHHETDAQMAELTSETK